MRDKVTRDSAKKDKPDSQGRKKNNPPNFFSFFRAIRNEGSCIERARGTNATELLHAQLASFVVTCGVH